MNSIARYYYRSGGGLRRVTTALSLSVSVLVIASGLIGCGTPQPTPTNTPTALPDTPTPELVSTPEATSEPLIPLDDDPVLGSLDAPVTMIEYSEYLCPFCQRFVLETLPQIEEEYINSGQVKLVFRDFPVHGQPAIAMAIVAECAADQGMFWEMHVILFERTEEWSQSEDLLATVQGYAEDMGIDTDDFTACLQEGRPIERIREDYTIGVQDGVNATPTFLVNGIEIRGAQPFEEFQRVIEEQLQAST